MSPFPTGATPPPHFPMYTRRPGLCGSEWKAWNKVRIEFRILESKVDSAISQQQHVYYYGVQYPLGKTPAQPLDLEKLKEHTRDAHALTPDDKDNSRDGGKLDSALKDSPSVQKQPVKNRDNSQLEPSEDFTGVTASFSKHIKELLESTRNTFNKLIDKYQALSDCYEDHVEDHDVQE